MGRDGLHVGARSGEMHASGRSASSQSFGGGLWCPSSDHRKLSASGQRDLACSRGTVNLSPVSYTDHQHP